MGLLYIRPRSTTFLTPGYLGVVYRPTTGVTLFSASQNSMYYTIYGIFIKASMVFPVPIDVTTDVIVGYKEHNINIC